MKQYLIHTRISRSGLLVICGLFVCNFVFMQLRVILFSGTCTQIYSYPWPFNSKCEFVNFFVPSLSIIIRKTVFKIIIVTLADAWLNPCFCTRWLIISSRSLVVNQQWSHSKELTSESELSSSSADEGRLFWGWADVGLEVKAGVALLGLSMNSTSGERVRLA